MLHRAAYAELGLDWTYDADRVGSGGLGGVPRRARPGVARAVADDAAQARGAAAASTGHDWARLAGAVNTLVLEDDGGRHGHNTDLPGAVAAIRERTSGPLVTAVDARRRRDGHLGRCSRWPTSACARAPCWCARRPGRRRPSPPSRRTRPRPRSMVSSLGDVRPAGADILVSTVPASAQTPELVAALRGRAGRLRRALRPVADAPRAAAAGRTVVGGLDLLVHQAVRQVELFTGRTVAGRRADEKRGERALAARHAG